MSATATLMDEVASATSEAGLETASPGRPSYEEVLVAIMEDSALKDVPCDYKTAVAVYNVLGRAAAWYREHSCAYHLDGKELTIAHKVLDVIMVDDVDTPSAGTAHALLGERLLPAGRTFMHTKEGPVLEYCAIAVHVLEAR
jgi:hypothetical protein